MDPVLKMWLYQQWLGDHRDDAELAKNHAYLLGSFSNPEAVKQMMDGNAHESSEEEFEESSRIVRDFNQAMETQKEAPTKRKRRKVTIVKG
jgi:transposase-like protein